MLSNQHRDRNDNDILRWLSELNIGPVSSSDCSWPNSKSRVLKLKDGAGRFMFLKAFAAEGKYKAALHAYRNWLPKLTFAVPELIDFCNSRKFLLISAVGDSLPQINDLPRATQHHVMTQAAIFLKQLHQLKYVDEDSVPLGAAMQMRAQNCGQSFDRSFGERNATRPPIVTAATIDRAIREVIEIKDELNQFQRVPCHRDFWQRNWNSLNGHSAQTLAIIDFEHSQADFFMMDFMKMWADLWVNDPSLEDTFWTHYGWSPNQHMTEVMRRCGRLHALQTIAWAIENSNHEFLKQGQRLHNHLCVEEK